MKSIIYWHPWIYTLAMKSLHGKGYSARYKIIAKEVEGMSVLDLCCGDCKLADYVRNYKGIDYNNIFVKKAKKRGLDVTKGDITKNNIPKSECIVMQESLYQFVPHHEGIIKGMLKKAKKVIICEKGVHMAQSKNPLTAFISKKLTNTHKSNKRRFQKKQLVDLYKKFHAKKIIHIGKDVIGVFKR